MTGKTIDEVNIGEKAFYQKTITEFDVYSFVAISGDNNSAHINEIHAKNTIFKGRIVHGLLTASLISGVLGTKLPGEGTIYLSQDLEFLAPVRFNDTIKAEVEVIAIDYEKSRITLSTKCTNQNNELVLTGQAVVKPPVKKEL